MINLGQAHMLILLLTKKLGDFVDCLSGYFLRFMIGVVMMEFRGEVGQIAKGEFTLVEGIQSLQ